MNLPVSNCFSIAKPTIHTAWGYRLGDLVIHEIYSHGSEAKRVRKGWKFPTPIKGRWGFAHFYTGADLTFLAPIFFWPPYGQRAPQKSRIFQKVRAFHELTAEIWVENPEAFWGKPPPAYLANEEAVKTIARLIFGD